MNRFEALRTATRAAVQAALVCLLLVVGQAAPALAHGFPTAGPPNWISQVTEVGTQGLAWSVVGVDAALRLENSSGREVLVRGYADEPYLRVGPDGVFENRRSTAAYLNQNRLGDLTTIRVPDDVDNTAPPDWVRVGAGPTWTWFDHRIHWISAVRLPAGVMAEPDREQVVSNWTVPAEQSGERVGPAGELRWVPPANTRIPVLVLAVVFAAGLAVVTRRRGGTALAAVLLVVTVLAGVAEVGALLELGAVAGDGAVISVWIRSVLLAMVAAAALLLVRRDDGRASWLLGAVAVIVAFTVGWRELEVVARPAVPGPLPAVVILVVVAVALASGPAALALVRTGTGDSAP